MLRYFNRKNGFTLAEILITLGIIGVIAAMTIPVIITNYQKHLTITKLKKTYSQLNQLMKVIDEEHGLNVLTGEPKTFVPKYILPHFNGATLYPASSDHKLAMCYNENGYLGAPKSKAQYAWWKNQGYVSTPFMPNHTTTISLPDGTCLGFNRLGLWSGANVFVDINGSNKGPNWGGRDLFFFDYDIDTGSIKPADWNIEEPDCATSKNGHPKGWGCAAKIMKDNWKINKDYNW